MSHTVPDFAPEGMVDMLTAARQFDLKHSTVYRLVRTRAIPSKRVYRQIFIRPEDLQVLLRQSGRGGAVA